MPDNRISDSRATALDRDQLQEICPVCRNPVERVKVLDKPLPKCPQHGILKRVVKVRGLQSV